MPETVEPLSPEDQAVAETIFAKLQAGVADLGQRQALARVHREIARDNAWLRRRFLADFDALPAADAALIAGVAMDVLDRWRAEAQIFSVPVGDAELFPAFQFAGSALRPAIGQVLAALPARMSAWEVALWFVSANSWLGGPAPVSLLGDYPEAVAAVAAHEAGEFAG